MAKLGATTAAQEVIGMAVQLHGGGRVRQGVRVGASCRDIRALRIGVGARDIRRRVIARSLPA